MQTACLQSPGLLLARVTSLFAEPPTYRCLNLFPSCLLCTNWFPVVMTDELFYKPSAAEQHCVESQPQPLSSVLTELFCIAPAPSPSLPSSFSPTRLPPQRTVATKSCSLSPAVSSSTNATSDVTPTAMTTPAPRQIHKYKRLRRLIAENEILSDKTHRTAPSFEVNDGDDQLKPGLSKNVRIGNVVRPLKRLRGRQNINQQPAFTPIQTDQPSTTTAPPAKRRRGRPTKPRYPSQTPIHTNQSVRFTSPSSDDDSVDTHTHPVLTQHARANKALVPTKKRRGKRKFQHAPSQSSGQTDLQQTCIEPSAKRRRGRPKNARTLPKPSKHIDTPSRCTASYNKVDSDTYLGDFLVDHSHTKSTRPSEMSQCNKLIPLQCPLTPLYMSATSKESAIPSVNRNVIPPLLNGIIQNIPIIFPSRQSCNCAQRHDSPFGEKQNIEDTEQDKVQERKGRIIRQDHNYQRVCDSKKEVFRGRQEQKRKANDSGGGGHMPQTKKQRTRHNLEMIHPTGCSPQRKSRKYQQHRRKEAKLPRAGDAVEIAWEDRSEIFRGVLFSAPPIATVKRKWDFTVAYDDGDWILENLDDCTWRFVHGPDIQWRHAGDLKLVQTEDNDEPFRPIKSARGRRKQHCKKP